VDVPEAQIDASPDLVFNVDGRKIDVTGSVNVPDAKIVPKDLTGAVLSSSDEVIVGSETEDPAKRFEVVTSIALVLGDHVSIETSGLTGRLTGSITVRSGYDAVTRATGELSIEEGKYVAYAHNMDIQHGRLIFTGGPVDDPGIDIRAIRKFPDVTAGVNVRGTLLQPRLSFFSEPSLAQADIVSLLLSGSLSTASTRPNGAAGNTALVQGGAMLAQEVGQHVGIQEVGVESNLLTNDTSVVLGRYLSPRLYVGYGVSLTENLNVLKLRYSLGDHWVVRTEVGQARGADLIYTIEK
jgi:translocation and assembly module TamB